MAKWQCSEGQARAAEHAYWHDKYNVTGCINDMRLAITTAVGAEVDALHDKLDAAVKARDQWCKDFGIMSEQQADGLSRESVLRAQFASAEAALQKINAIRNSIVGCQTVNFSEHVYPLVAALDEAGFVGDGYDVSRKNVGTMMQQRDAATARAEQAERDLAAMRGERDGARMVCVEIAARCKLWPTSLGVVDPLTSEQRALVESWRADAERKGDGA
jgi:hypothetical protein